MRSSPRLNAPIPSGVGRFVRLLTFPVSGKEERGREAVPGWNRMGEKTSWSPRLADKFSLMSILFLTRDAFRGIFATVEKWGRRRFRRPFFVAGHTAPSVPMSSPGTSPGMTEERKKRRGSRARPYGEHDHACDRHRYRLLRRPGGVRGRAPPRHADPLAPRERAFGICRRKCRQAGGVGKCRHSRSAFEGRECRPGSDLPTRCLCRRRERASHEYCLPARRAYYWRWPHGNGSRDGR